MRGGEIVFDGVWKKFRRGERHDSLRDLIPSLFRYVRGGRRTDLDDNREFWAVHDVSFRVEAGQALGIIGPNGAGKSTVLKLLNRILRPTRGVSRVSGRVGALIEIAAGFHPDLTGLENIYLQGAIMGMRRADISRRLDDIIDFCGLHAFIDTPVKRYSSGMNARLGFAIAANLDPDVLIIDEVLAVGDMAFQQRCIDRMQHFRRQGVAIAFVSHNLQAVTSLCDRAIFLHHGVVQAHGPAGEVIQSYVMQSVQPGDAAAREPVSITHSALCHPDGRPVTAPLAPGARVTLRAGFRPHVAAGNVTVGLVLYRSSDNLLLYDGHFGNRQLGISSLEPDQEFELAFGFAANLSRGHYHVLVRVYDNTAQRFLASGSVPATFVVEEFESHQGMVHLDVEAAVLNGAGTTSGMKVAR